MISRKVHIPGWTILFLFSFDRHDMESIRDALLWAEAPDSIIDDVSENVYSGRLNEGFTFSEPSLRRTVFATSGTTSGPEMLNTIVHEIVHIAQHISEENGIDPLSERMAYLCGDIASSVSDIVCRLSCPHCNK
jgi:hypothetical protein